jgi:hypothetical protein
VSDADRRRRLIDRLAGRGAVLAVVGLAAVAGLVSDSDAGRGLAVLALATAPALFAVPPRGRLPLGVVLMGAGVAVPLLSAGSRDAATWVSAASMVVAGVLVAWRGRTWSQLSGRYQRGTTEVQHPESADPRSLWTALDRGEDPTAGAPGGDS